jgi:cyclophilin family peptidyl-prolyl cis-trans isomerase
MTPGDAAAMRSRQIAGRLARALLLSTLVLCGIAHGDAAPAGTRTAAPVLVVDTSQGSFAIATSPEQAPLSVAHIVSLVKAGFYDGQRIHRAVPGFLVQFGDPQTRDLEKRPDWGRGMAASSGSPIGAAEVSTERRNVALAVGLAHMGEPAQADSQLYVLLADRPELDGRYAVIGHVIEGADVLQRLQVGDQLRRVYVRE